MPRETVSLQIFKCCHPQILRGQFLNTLPHMVVLLNALFFQFTIGRKWVLLNLVGTFFLIKVDRNLSLLENMCILCLK